MYKKNYFLIFTLSLIFTFLLTSCGIRENNYTASNDLKILSEKTQVNAKNNYEVNGRKVISVKPSSSIEVIVSSKNNVVSENATDNSPSTATSVVSKDDSGNENTPTNSVKINTKTNSKINKSAKISSDNNTIKNLTEPIPSDGELINLTTQGRDFEVNLLYMYLGKETINQGDSYYYKLPKPYNSKEYLKNLYKKYYSEEYFNKHFPMYFKYIDNQLYSIVGDDTVPKFLSVKEKKLEKGLLKVTFNQEVFGEKSTMNYYFRYEDSKWKLDKIGNV